MRRCQIQCNSETIGVLHAFLSLVVAKLSDLKISPIFWLTLFKLVLCLQIHTAAGLTLSTSWLGMERGSLSSRKWIAFRCDFTPLKT